jgi:TPR repeat protein
MTRFPLLPAAPRAAVRRGLVVATTVLLSVSATAWAGEVEDVLWAEASRHYKTQHFAGALLAYERLAERGDARAAERAGLMLLLGPALYGDAVPQEEARALAWLRQAAAAGSSTAELLAERLEHRRAPAEEEEPYVPGPHGC